MGGRAVLAAFIAAGLVACGNAKARENIAFVEGCWQWQMTRPDCYITWTLPGPISLESQWVG